MARLEAYNIPNMRETYENMFLCVYVISGVHRKHKYNLRRGKNTGSDMKHENEIEERKKTSG